MSFCLALATAALFRCAFRFGASVSVVYVRKACTTQKDVKWLSLSSLPVSWLTQWKAVLPAGSPAVSGSTRTVCLSFVNLMFFSLFAYQFSWMSFSCWVVTWGWESYLLSSQTTSHQDSPWPPQNQPCPCLFLHFVTSPLDSSPPPLSWHPLWVSFTNLFILFFVSTSFFHTFA